MERRLLFSKFKNETTMSRVRKKIAVAPGENLIHRADALKLGLQVALESKKRRPQTGATETATLVWDNSTCPDCPVRPARISYLNPIVRCERCKKEYRKCSGCYSLCDVNTVCGPCNPRAVVRALA